MGKISLIAETARLIGDPARANMLFAMKDDGAVSAGDLANVAGVAPSTASEHLARLTAAGLIRLRKSGRHRYFRLKSPQVAEALEGLEHIAGNLAGGLSCADSGKDVEGRKCYDHLAGPLGVKIAGAMLSKGFLSITQAGTEPTHEGAVWLIELGTDPRELRRTPRRFIRMCPDASEGGFHLGGALGAALFTALSGRDWIRRQGKSTAIVVPPFGIVQFRTRLGILAGRPQ